MRLWAAMAVDVICVLIFAIVGRSNHNEANDLLGVVRTAWPFLVGGLAGALAGRTWHRPTALLSGVATWLGALVIGMLLRLATGAGVQLPFVIVAALVLALLLVGWRAAFGLIQRARHHRPPS